MAGLCYRKEMLARDFWAPNKLPSISPTLCMNSSKVYIIFRGLVPEQVSKLQAQRLELKPLAAGHARRQLAFANVTTYYRGVFQWRW